MKKVIILLTVFFAIIFTQDVLAQRGYYKNGRGSSHKGGSYKNKATHDHYRERK